MAGGRVNWSRKRARDRMRRQGVEDRRDKTPPRDEPREQAEAAFLAWRKGQAAKDK
jgi:hypothetical protein